MDSLLNNLD